MASSVDGSRGARRREQSEIYASILEVVKRHHGAARITRLSYGVGMPVDRLRIAVDRLVSLGLLCEGNPEGRAAYDITARGHEFLTTYWKMRAFIELMDVPVGRTASSPYHREGENPQP